MLFLWPVVIWEHQPFQQSNRQGGGEEYMKYSPQEYSDCVFSVIFCNFLFGFLLSN